MATLEATWDLRSTSHPRCLTAFPSLKIPMPSLSSSSSSRNFPNKNVNMNNTSTSASASTNPFDLAHNAAAAASSSLNNNSGNNTSSFPSSSSSTSFGYSVVFGSERGALHYRTYSTSSNASKQGKGSMSMNTSNSSSSSSRQIQMHQQQRYGSVGVGGGDSHTTNPAQPQQPVGMGGRNDGTHPIHKPIDASPKNTSTIGPIVNCIHATLPPLLSNSTSNSNNPYHPTHPLHYQQHQAQQSHQPLPIFLVLKDDNRGSAGVNSSTPGAYAASLMTLNYNASTFTPFHISTNAAAVPPSSSNSSSATSNNMMYNNNSNSNHSNVLKHVNATSLPRMSCASYHPTCGYVYAAGTSVYTLPPPITYAISLSLTDNHPNSSSSASPPHPHSRFQSRTNLNSTTSNNLKQYHYQPTVYFHAKNILPTPGARSGSDALTLACRGKVAIVAVGNTFHAVGGLPLPPNYYAPPSSSQQQPSSQGNHNPSSNNNNNLHNNDYNNPYGYVHSTEYLNRNRNKSPVEKILSFAQSSQVHPAIAIHVPVPSYERSVPLAVADDHARSNKFGTDSGAGGNRSNYNHFVMQHHPMEEDDDEPSTSLLFLASGRECAVVELLHNPRFYSRDGGGEETNKNLATVTDGDAYTTANSNPKGSNATTMIGGSIVVAPPRHGIATLANPILAAVGIIPPLYFSSSSSSASSSRYQYAYSSSSRSNRYGTNAQHSGNSNHDHQLHYGGPLIAVLTSDGLVHTRSPSCIAIPLSTIEVGNQPNDFFTLSPLPRRKIVAASYSGEGRLLSIRSDTQQDLADRLMKLSIDAFGANGFPRSELAEAVGASFSATSYVGAEPTAYTRGLLRQYLEAILGLNAGKDFAGEMISTWAHDDDEEEGEEEDGYVAGFGGDLIGGTGGGLDGEIDGENHHQSLPSNSTSFSPPAFLSGSALLCLVCSLLSPPNGILANRAAKSCATKMGVVSNYKQGGVNQASVQVCEQIADRLLKESSNNFSLLNPSSPKPIQSSNSNSHNRSNKVGAHNMDMVEAAVWLLRSCGQHERAIEVLQDRMNNPLVRNWSGVGGGLGSGANDEGENFTATANGGGKGQRVWSRIKYESYTAAHLGELWSCGDDNCCRLVLRSSATKELLESNSSLGLSIFTSPHPQNEQQWSEMVATEDPLANPNYPMKVVELLKSVHPILPYDGPASGDDALKVRSSSRDMSSMGSTMMRQTRREEGAEDLPLESGRALAVTYLESAIGISSGRPTILPNDDAFSSLPPDEHFEDRLADLHDELAYLFLEGVISERGDDESDVDSELGMLYRGKLRRLLSWPNAKVRSELLMASLPTSFLRERALLLGRLGRHEDALRILYNDLQSLDLALEYCDYRYERRQESLEQDRRLAKGRNEHGIDDLRDGTGMGKRRDDNEQCAYLPLVSVALESDPDTERGIAAAIQVLSLRRGAIDRSAALRLLPSNIPVSAVARPFLIPALIDSESQVRRLKIVSALLRAKYVDLKRSLTEAQIKSQANLHAVPALQALNLGEPLYSSKPFKARPSHMSAAHFPDVMIIKHFFPRYVVIQAKVTNSAPSLEGRTLGEVAFVVAESSDEALLPSLNVPLKTLPPKVTGSSWCVLVAAPQRLDGTAVLACELRYTVLAVDTATGAPLNFSGGFASAGLGRTFVEELQDIEIRHAEFEG